MIRRWKIVLRSPRPASGIALVWAFAAASAWGIVEGHRATQHETAYFYGAGGLAATLSFALLVIAVTRQQKVSAFVLVICLVGGITALVLAFSRLYYEWGANHNWNIALTRGDAVYVALGTLTTGAPGVTPTSEQARTLMTAQQVSDLVFLIFVVGLVLDRLTRSRA